MWDEQILISPPILLKLYIYHMFRGWEDSAYYGHHCGWCQLMEMPASTVHATTFL